MIRDWTALTVNCKRFFASLVVIASLFVMSGCSTNPATGEKQFTALMSPVQEERIGADEHKKILELFGPVQAGDPLQIYLEEVGAKVAANTERTEVKYKFFLLDSPIVNAFALPGGYIYASRGLLVQANSEAELAGVLAHEIGHITARHSAERYSHGILTSLGSLVLAVASENANVARAASMGSDLYIKSYSRSQEHQADDLGIRYLQRAGYDTGAMASFLTTLAAHDTLQKRIAGYTEGSGFNYFSTHPPTQDRIVQAKEIASGYPDSSKVVGRDVYLNKINGMIYGDSERQGFAKYEAFYHPVMGFTFTVPMGFRINNQPQQVSAINNGAGSVVIFDSVSNKQMLDPISYLKNIWMKSEPISDVDTIIVNGMEAATGSFPGKLKGKNVTIRLVAFEWDKDTIFRFQIAIPHGASAEFLDDFKLMTYSLRHLSGSEKTSIKPYHLKVVNAGPDDTLESLSARLPHRALLVERFRVLNALTSNDEIIKGRAYKTAE